MLVLYVMPFLGIRIILLKDRILFHTYVSMEPSINNVTHFLRFLTPPSPLSPILLHRLQILADPCSPLSWWRHLRTAPKEIAAKITCSLVKFLETFSISFLVTYPS